MPTEHISLHPINKLGLVPALMSLGLHSGVISQSTLVGIIELLGGKVRERDESAEVMLHVPAAVVERMTDVDGMMSRTEPYSYTLWRNGEPRLLLPSVTVEGYKGDLLWIGTGLPFDVMLVASPSIAARLGSDDPVWHYVVSFSDSEIVHGCRGLGKLIPVSGYTLPVSEWLESLARRLAENGESSASGVVPTDFFTEWTYILDQHRERKEEQLNWFQLISRVQEAVGWELDPGDIAAATARILKETIGYDYFELHIYETDEDVATPKHNYQQNDTSYGGPLLTIILHKEPLTAIIKGGKPVLLDTQSGNSLMMNPLLLKYMELESGIVVPLVYHDNCNGLIKLFAHERNHYTAMDITRLETIGKIIARSIENIKTHLIMCRMATIDGLTGIYNHRFLMEQASRELKRAVRYNTHLTMIMLDIDFFKNYNDTNGHLQGDQVLRVVAKTLRDSVRGADIVARYGGEEFVVILPETTLDQGLVVAEKIRLQIADYPFKNRESQPAGKVTVSMGLATTGASVDHISELINRADTALYQAKRSGRNQCVVFQS